MSWSGSCNIPVGSEIDVCDDLIDEITLNGFVGDEVARNSAVIPLKGAARIILDGITNYPTTVPWRVTLSGHPDKEYPDWAAGVTVSVLKMGDPVKIKDGDL